MGLLSPTKLLVNVCLLMQARRDRDDAARRLRDAQNALNAAN